MTINDYLSKLNTRYKAGISTEHSYRGDLQNLLESLLPEGLLITNEPTRISCGAPDYIVSKGSIPVGYIEAKDLGADLTHKGFTEQFERYKESLSNLVLTNYVEFIFIKNVKRVAPLPSHPFYKRSQTGRKGVWPFYELIPDSPASAFKQSITKKLPERMPPKRDFYERDGAALKGRKTEDNLLKKGNIPSGSLKI